MILKVKKNSPYSFLKIKKKISFGTISSISSLVFGGRSKKKEGKGPKTLVDDNAPCVFKKLRKN